MCHLCGERGFVFRHKPADADRGERGQGVVDVGENRACPAARPAGREEVHRQYRVDADQLTPDILDRRARDQRFG